MSNFFTVFKSSLLQMRKNASTSRTGLNFKRFNFETVTLIDPVHCQILHDSSVLVIIHMYIMFDNLSIKLRKCVLHLLYIFHTIT